MRHLIHILLLLTLSVTATQAQQFGTFWMTSPSSTNSSCQWFRRTFVATEHDSPRRASICVATDSHFVLYVNGRNVSTALYTSGYDAVGKPRTISITYDVTRFLRRDSNTVALLLCPPVSRHMTVDNKTMVAPPKIAVNFFGTTATNHYFSYSSSDGWLCHSASTIITPDGELMDGRHAMLPPSYGDMTMPSWHPVVGVAAFDTDVVTDYGIASESIYGYRSKDYNILTDNSIRTHSIHRPRYFDPEPKQVVYDFSPGFYGFVRVTLRGCRRGEIIHIGNLTYICTGEMDEQAFCRFTPQFARKVVISGDRWFRIEQVQEVEAIGI